MTRISDAKLRSIRNEFHVDILLSNHLDVPIKRRDGYLRFLCPLCGEFNTATNPRTNLGRCFRCAKNFNPIDLVMAFTACDFLAAVRFLEKRVQTSE